MSEAASALTGEAPAATEAPVAQAPAVSEAPAAPAAGNDEATTWLTGLEEGTREYLNNKGWAADDPQDAILRVVEGYRNAEKMIGGRVKIPEAGDEDGWNDLYKRLGRPDEPTQYELKNLPEEQDAKMVEFYRNAAHRAGMTPQQADVFLNEYNQFQQQQVEGFNANLTNTQLQDIDNLRQEWGDTYEENIALGRRSVQAAAGVLGADGVDLIENAIGTARTLKLFASLGKNLAEDAYVGSDDTGGFTMTVTKAQQQLASRKEDPNFMARYLRGERDAEAEFNKLMAAAHPTKERR